MKIEDSAGKVAASSVFNAEKGAEAIMHVFTEGELNIASEHKLFSVSDEVLDSLAESNSALSVPAKKTRFCKTVILGQVIGNLDAIDWNSERIDWDE